MFHEEYMYIYFPTHIYIFRSICFYIYVCIYLYSNRKALSISWLGLSVSVVRGALVSRPHGGLHEGRPETPRHHTIVMFERGEFGRAELGVLSGCFTTDRYVQFPN